MSYIGELKERIDTLKDIKDKEIDNVLSEIVKRYEEMEEELINYETSQQLGLGCEVLKLGKIFNAINNASGLEECLKNLNNLYELELFDSDSDSISEMQKKVLDLEEKSNYFYEEVKVDITILLEKKIFQCVLDLSK